MGFRTRAEKRMRKFLIEQIKARKQHGARIAEERKTKQDLINLNLAPQVFVFKNLFSGQVLYSQVPAYHENQIKQQFVRPNWENRKPSRRQDLWKIMCVVNFDNYDYALAAYRGLIDLRKARDIYQKKEANSMRKKNEDGNIWYSGQFRPTYTQEAVADLSHIIEEFELEGTRIFWANEWHRGDDKHWRLDLVDHDKLPVYTPKKQSVLLDVMRQKAIEAFREKEGEAPKVEEAEAQTA
ncbi:MHR1 Mitochondrialous recombination protein 1 [Candida maltosa Xu316]|uniref:Large ribosomal subunit protein mL67 n=1 Tax=Candida maltosa (strain Xu316) TaxID=1245528 RepID=M3JZC1_CANMX|nr:recombination-like protein 1 [Candida maltosa Xu316]